MNNFLTMRKPYFFTIVISLFITLTFLCPAHLQAQYSHALGIRIGGTSGVVGKYFYKPTIAAEGIIGTFGNGFSITGLLEKYEPVYNATGLYVYYGGGAHVAFYDGRSSNYSHFGREVDYRRHNNVGFGVNVIVGAEYRLPENIPIAFSLDLKPFIEVGSGGYVAVAPDPSIGIKFIFK
jgi:hypothetical protein